MDLIILIADPRDIYRSGLRSTFASDKRVAQIYEAKTQEEFQQHINTRSFDMLVVNQIFVTDISLLPRGQFAILTSELDITLLQKVHNHGARAYLLESASEDLVRATLSCENGAFLIEPAIGTQIMEYVSSATSLVSNDGLLTPREREIVRLLREGIDRPTIALQLCISEATLKTHIKNITRKQKDTEILGKAHKAYL